MTGGEERGWQSQEKVGFIAKVFDTASFSPSLMRVIIVRKCQAPVEKWPWRLVTSVRKVYIYSRQNDEERAPMKLVYRGKTKDVYESGDNTFCLKFSDRVTKNAEGEVDPGGNTVAETTVPGQAAACLQMSSTIFKELARQGLRTHMLDYDLEALTMTVKKARLFSPGLEWVARWVCTGSFLRRYAMVPGIEDGVRFAEPVFEITLKDDDAGDPLIVPSAIVALGIVDVKSMEALEAANRQALKGIHAMFDGRGLDLWDIKIEWALDSDGTPLLIDEVSPGSCRAFKKGTRERVSGVALADYFA